MVFYIFETFRRSLTALRVISKFSPAYKVCHKLACAYFSNISSNHSLPPPLCSRDTDLLFTSHTVKFILTSKLVHCVPSTWDTLLPDLPLVTSFHHFGLS